MVEEAGEKTKRSGAALARLNRRFPWLKMVVLLIITVAVAAYVVLKPMMEDGRLIFEFTLSSREIVTESEPVTQPEPVPVVQQIPVPDLTGKMLIALTFDDGPDAEVTPRVLDVLQEKQARATFFVLGQKMQGLPDIVRRAEKEGHEIESHSLWHGNLSTFSRDEVFNDYNSSREIFQEVLGHEFKMLRPPYGAVNSYVRELPVPLMAWSVDTEDWKSKDAGSVLWHTQNYSFDGAVVLMHDVHPSTVEAVGPVIDDLRSRGYEFVTVSELANLRGVELTPGVMWGRFRVDGE